MSYAVDIFQNPPPDKKWTGVVTQHPDEGGPGVEVHRRPRYSSEAAATEGCDRAIARLVPSGKKGTVHMTTSR